MIPHCVLPWIAFEDKLIHLCMGLDLQEEVVEIHRAHQPREGRETEKWSGEYALLNRSVLRGGRFDKKICQRDLLPSVALSAHLCSFVLNLHG